VDWFIRSEYVSNWTAEKDSDFINEPDRAQRCNDAAEFGCDGKTHFEVIEDWRDSFRNFVRYDVGRIKTPFRTRHNSFRTLDRFEDVVNAHFDSVEEWHLQNGSLHQQIG
jgi:hypothetical protein